MLNFGGSLIKNKEIYGLHNSELMGEDSIISLTKRFREEGNEHLDWLIIGTDYAGNPIGISKEGKVLLQDYDNSADVRRLSGSSLRRHSWRNSSYIMRE